MRPGTEEFLKQMSTYYEIVIFTAATQDYADWVIDKIDPKHYISHRLYRQHAYSKDPNLRVVKASLFIIKLTLITGFEIPWKRLEEDNNYR